MSIRLGYLIKLLLTVLGIFIIAYIFIVSLRTDRGGQPEGEFARLQDVLILVEALNESYRNHNVYIELQKIEEADSESLITYRQFEQLVSLLEEERKADVSADQASKRKYCQKLKANYAKKYGKESFLLIQDWHQFYDSWIEAEGIGSSIQKIEVTVLGTGNQVADREGKPLTEYSLLAEEGIYTYQSDLFSRQQYQRLIAYSKNGILLTPISILDSSMKLKNIWVIETEEDGLQIFYKEHEIWISFGEIQKEQREQVTDLEFSDGKLQSIKVKKEKIGGKLLRIGDGILEIEGVGNYPYQEDMKVYRLYNRLEEGKLSDLRIGYEFTDFVIEDGKVCAGLISRDEAMEHIRVLIKNTGFADVYHEKVVCTADTDFILSYGEYGDRKIKEFRAGEVVEIEENSDYLKEERISIEPKAQTGKISLLSVERSQGEPAYRGRMEVAKTKEGLIIINEVLLEEYLYSVVPSEMPASYPLEALKAQAVCARTYAYRYMQSSGAGRFGAHVDDSVSYQVYNNISENAQTTKAVKETSGKLLYYGDELCGAYYYSTSCGFGTDTGVWKSESQQDTSYLLGGRIGTEDGGYTSENMMDEETFAAFISHGASSDYESEEAWYRWSYQVEEAEEEEMMERLKKRFETNPELILTQTKEGDYESVPLKNLGSLQDLQIVKRGRGGVADELIIKGTKNTYKVISEYNIRYVLSDGKTKIIRQDGSEASAASLLPSAYFTITVKKNGEELEGYHLTGGGYGHGVGMSQNAARQMAQQGQSADGILTFFYQNCEVRNIYEEKEAG